MKLTTVFNIARAMPKVGLSLAGFATAAAMIHPDTSQASSPLITDDAIADLINSAQSNDTVHHEYMVNYEMDNGHFINFGPAAPQMEGQADYCKRFGDECANRDSEEGGMVTDPDLIAQIADVNRYVNDNTVQVNDIDSYGVDEKWNVAPQEQTDPSKYFGDCEDIVLKKMELLEQKGVDFASMSIVVVDPHLQNQNGFLHAVLAVRTGGGDYILDNLTNDMKFPEQTGYTAIQATSLADLTKWQKISWEPKKGFAPDNFARPDDFMAPDPEPVQQAKVAPVMPMPYPTWR